MNRSDEEKLWRQRFRLFALLRLSGLALFFVGMAIAFTGLVRPGGWPPAGLFVGVLGLAEAVLVPALLKRGWQRR